MREDPPATDTRCAVASAWLSPSRVILSCNKSRMRPPDTRRCSHTDPLVCREYRAEHRLDRVVRYFNGLLLRLERVRASGGAPAARWRRWASGSASARRTQACCCLPLPWRAASATDRRPIACSIAGKPSRALQRAPRGSRSIQTRLWPRALRCFGACSRAKSGSRNHGCGGARSQSRRCSSKAYSR